MTSKAETIDDGVTLPLLTGMTDLVVGGRVPKHGYQRGWGLQFGELMEQVAASPLYQEAMATLQGVRSHLDQRKGMNLFLIITKFLPHLASQNIIEFGTYKGGSALMMGALLRRINTDAKIYALDTFEGMPETDRKRDAHSAGDFFDADLPHFRSLIAQAGLEDTVIPVKGLFQDTFPDLAKQTGRFGLAHIDCDIYSAVKYAQDAVWPIMAEGGYLVYDDADISSCIGATEAVEELIMDRGIHSEQIWPHFVFRTHL